MLRSTLVILSFVLAGWPCNVHAINGVDPIQFTPESGWTGFELVTQGNSIGGIADGGYGSTAGRGKYDGLGAYLHSGVVTVFVNHEETAAAVSRLDVDRTRFRQAIDSRIDGGVTPFPTSFVTGMGYAYQAIYDGSYHAITKPNPVATGTAAVGTYGDANFSRFCSGTLHEADAFGASQGLVDPMYLTGEEIAGGQFYALDLTTRSYWQVPALGTGHWENAAVIDAGNTTHIALLSMSDVGAAPGDYIRLYVGAKNVDANGDGAVDFLERNGLRGGTVYYFDPAGAASIIDLPDGSVVGAWSAATTGALQETKVEDVHTNPFDGKQAVFAATNDGVYRMDLNLQFSGGAFNPASSTTTIAQLLDDDTTALAEPDNLVWSRNGKIYVQEDGAGDEMFQMNPDGSGLAKIATAFSEPSGIIDASALVRYEPGSVFLTSIMGSGTSGAQLSVMIAPGAAPLPPNANFNGDGVVDGADFLLWQRGLGTSTNAAPAQGDANGDGVVDHADLAAWKAQFGMPQATTAIPEPSAVALAVTVLCLLLINEKRPRSA